MDSFKDACALLEEQLGRDTVISLATCSDGAVSVRTVNGYYKDGCIYVLTHMSSGKMRDIVKSPSVAVCKDLFTARGTGESLGNPRSCGGLRDELREVFRAFYERHVNEDDPGTCILRIKLSFAAAFSDSKKYIVDFKGGSAEEFPFVNDIIY